MQLTGNRVAAKVIGKGIAGRAQCIQLGTPLRNERIFVLVCHVLSDSTLEIYVLAGAACSRDLHLQDAPATCLCHSRAGGNPATVIVNMWIPDLCYASPGMM
jgi:hypothetical protein